MALTKVKELTSIEYAPSEWTIRATEVTKIVETEGDVETIVSTSNHRLVYTPDAKQDAIDYGDDNLTALANQFFTETIIANWSIIQSGGNPADIPA